jgi:hypothetical protein
VSEQSPNASPQYQTDLGQTPLPEILVTIHRYKAPGVLVCRRGDTLKKIYFDQGDVIFASSNDIADSLGDKLLREGRITRQQYDESVQRLKTAGKRQGTILAEMKVLEPKDLFLAVRDQVSEIVWSIFSWDGGTVSFNPGRDKHLEFVKLQIPIPQAVLQGVRRMPDARTLIARLGKKTTLLARGDGAMEGVRLNADEQRLLDAANGKRMLAELVNTPPLTAGENARILYALFALRLLTVRQASGQIKVQLKMGKPTE